MSHDSIFRIYSMTKPITSVAAMILVEEGKIKLSDPVSMYLPELADLKVVTNADTAKDAASLKTRPQRVPSAFSICFCILRDLRMRSSSHSPAAEYSRKCIRTAG